jgi:hypothetical protein
MLAIKTECSRGRKGARRRADPQGLFLIGPLAVPPGPSPPRPSSPSLTPNPAGRGGRLQNAFSKFLLERGPAGSVTLLISCAHETHQPCVGRTPPGGADPGQWGKDVLPGGDQGHRGLPPAPPGRTHPRTGGIRSVGGRLGRDERRCPAASPLAHVAYARVGAASRPALPHQAQTRRFVRILDGMLGHQTGTIDKSLKTHAFGHGIGFALGRRHDQ